MRAFQTPVGCGRVLLACCLQQPASTLDRALGCAAQAVHHKVMFAVADAAASRTASALRVFLGTWRRVPRADKNARVYSPPQEQESVPSPSAQRGAFASGNQGLSSSIDRRRPSAPVNRQMMRSGRDVRNEARWLCSTPPWAATVTCHSLQAAQQRLQRKR